MSLRLSIIMPAYKVGPYIARAIHSVAKQGLLASEYEIIVVDDGSPDEVAEVVRTLMPQYPQLQLIQQANAGVSAARNKALDKANGTYVLAIDPDDYLAPNSLIRLLEQAEHENLDVLYGGYIFLKEDETEAWKADYSEVIARVVNGSEGYFACKTEETRDPDRSVGLLYRREFLERYAIRYPLQVPYLEDGLFLCKVFSVAQRVGFSDAPFYMRTTRPGSATNSNLVYTDEGLEGFLRAADDLRYFSTHINGRVRHADVVNQGIAKFVVSPLLIALLNRRYGSFYRLARQAQKMGFQPLNLEGVRGAVIFPLARHFNHSLLTLVFWVHNSYRPARKAALNKNPW